MQKYGFPLHTIDEVKYFVGNGIPKLIERALPSDVDKETFDKVLADFIQYYELHSADKTRPYDGIIDLIQIQIKLKVLQLNCVKLIFQIFLI